MITKVIIVDEQHIVIKVLNKSIVFSIKKRELLINNNWYISEIDDIQIPEKNCCFFCLLCTFNYSFFLIILLIFLINTRKAFKAQSVN